MTTNLSIIKCLSSACASLYCCLSMACYVSYYCSSVDFFVVVVVVVVVVVITLLGWLSLVVCYFQWVLVILLSIYHRDWHFYHKVAVTIYTGWNRCFGCMSLVLTGGCPCNYLVVLSWSNKKGGKESSKGRQYVVCRIYRDLVLESLVSWVGGR